MSHPTATPDAVVRPTSPPGTRPIPRVAAPSLPRPGARRESIAIRRWRATGRPGSMPCWRACRRSSRASCSRAPRRSTRTVVPRAAPRAVRGRAICASPGRWVRPAGPRSSRVSISAPWRRTGGARPWSASSTRCRGNLSLEEEGPSAALGMTTGAQRRKVR